MTYRRVALAVVTAAGIVAGLTGFHGQQPSPADSIERIAVYQNEAALQRAWALPVARLYGPKNYVFQENQSLCGPTSIADLLHSEGVATDPGMVLKHSNAATINGFLPLGLTLDEEAGLLERETGKPVKVLRGLSLETFRAEMAGSNDPNRRIIVNFSRAPLFGRGHGHFSPVLGYLAEEDLVFVGDVNAKYRPWLVPLSRLFDAQDTVDNSSHLKRGVLEVESQ
jgi:hypothetical protein